MRNVLARSFLLVLSVSAAGCGVNSLLGTWRYATEVVGVSSPEPRKVAIDLVLEEDGWRVGGECVAPLTYSTGKATLTTVDWTCPLQSGDGLPTEEMEIYTWKTGDVLLVRTATFTMNGERLEAEYSLKYQTDPQDPTVGTDVNFASKSGMGGARQP
jgi:hypothetical protein